MKKIRVIVNAVLAGICIGIGGTVFLSLESRLAGALLFTVGLFTIVSFGLELFTGKVGQLPQRGMRYLPELALIWLGNLAGTALAGMLVRHTRAGEALAARAAELCAAKLADGLASIFILSLLCGMLMYIAVETYRSCRHELGKYLGLFLGVSVFILCGFEHCVANMFYFTAAGAWSLRALGYLAVMTLGNSAGGLLMPLCAKFMSASEAEKQ